MTIGLGYLNQSRFLQNSAQSDNQSNSVEKQLESLWNSYYQAQTPDEQEKIWRQIKGLSLVSDSDLVQEMLDPNYNNMFQGMYANNPFAAMSFVNNKSGGASGGKGGPPGILHGMNPNYERDHAIIESISDEFDEAIGKALGYGDNWNWHDSHDRGKGLTKRDWAALVAAGDERVQILRYNPQTGEYDNVTSLYQGDNRLQEVQTGDFIEIKSQSQGTKTIQAGGDGEINGYDDRVIDGSLQAAVNGAATAGQEIKNDVEGMEDLNPNAYAAAVTDAATSKDPNSATKKSIAEGPSQQATESKKETTSSATKSEDDKKEKEKKAA